eukprot:TRINITY_DN36147_c0_g1_i1.p1 TRINITY_DN36147_c0_g1~~TRINITY_DN36147_c0_g1_i1.p1  ORF type:complete len:187 (+),score=41.14 TRINITY_DN36147_c0_g1_i1:79-639(+)
MLTVVGAAALAAVANVTSSAFDVEFDASSPGLIQSASHNSFSPTYPTEADARLHAPWTLRADCEVVYEGSLPEPPPVALLINGAGGLDPNHAQRLPLQAGVNRLRNVELTRLDTECLAAEGHQCFWFGQLTLYYNSGLPPEGGIRTRLRCSGLNMCEPGGDCFECVQHFDKPVACVPQRRVNSTQG